MKISFKYCLFEELFQLCSKPKPHISAVSQYFLNILLAIFPFFLRVGRMCLTAGINQTRRILQLFLLSVFVFPGNICFCFSIQLLNSAHRYLLTCVSICAPCPLFSA
uniref:Uncharacterized protein n=1 Tax=Anguilla anguilla TaxID=7936 RepID=A0A0E9XDW2_ANGAN